VLAITGARRCKELPDVPTFTELGYRSCEPCGWFGVFVPAATPKDVVEKLSGEIARIIRTPEVSGRLADMGLQPVGNTAAEFAAIMKSDAAVWAKAIREGKITLD
jgi:tripartite-type tricarboxylate transporter receptor subunit TctC